MIGSESGEGSDCLIAGGPGYAVEGVRIPVSPTTAYSAIIAHRLLESSIDDGGPVGEHVGQYVFHLEGGESIAVNLRERFEISTVPMSGGAPFVAFADQKDRLLPRHEGRWGDAGRRQTEVSRGTSRWFVLLVWRNPSPDKRLESIEVVAADRAFAIGAITVGTLDEDPISREGLKDVRIELQNSAGGKQPFDIEVDIDRGLATYPYPLPEASAEQFIGEGRKGWGEPPSWNF